MTQPSTRTSPLPLNQALKVYWKHLIGVALFPPFFFIGVPVFGVPQVVFLPIFFAVGFLALWPVITKTAPYMFWIVAMGVWMSSAMASVMLLPLLALFGVHIGE